MPMNDLHAEAKELIEKYNLCFGSRDILALRELYVASGPFTYFDNHANCDSTDLEDHLKKVKRFFDSQVEIAGLDTQVLSVHVNSGMACITAHVRYRGNMEQPVVWLTLVAEQSTSGWKIRHLHYSNLP